MLCSLLKSPATFFGLLCCFITAIQAGAFSSASAAHRAAEIAVERKSPEYTWILRTPDKPGLVQVSLDLLDAGGGKITGLTVTGEVWMPEMSMQGYPMSLEFQETEDGVYVALVPFGHGGYWQIRARFKDTRGRLLEQSFDLEIGHGRPGS
jgi:hypothetical protein